MSDPVSKPAPANARAPENNEPTTTEIDARHARQLVERAFSQLERGERSAAEVSVRQAIHLSPGVPAVHSLAGLLALLDGDMETARIGYENAVTDFSKASPERERLIALRMAQADNSGLDAGAFVPDLPAEIARLRALVQAAPPQSFLSEAPNPKHAQPRSPHQPKTSPPIATPSPAIASPPANSITTRPAFASRLQQRQRASAWAVGIAAVSAAIVAFFVVRALVAPKPAPQAGSTPVANQVVVENPPPVPDSTTEIPAASGTDSTPDAEAPASNAADGSTPNPTPPAPTATVTVKPLPPTHTTPAPHPAPKPAAKPKPTPPTATPAIPGLPRPAPTSPSTPRPTPAPAPRDPNFPPMPAPKITLPSAGGEKTEFPRVIPDND